MNENVYFLSDAHIFKAIGGKVRFWRLQQNLSQLELSRQAMVSLSTLQKLERGEPVSLDRLVKILRILRKLEIFSPFLAEEEISPARFFELQEKIRHRQRASKSNEK